METNELKKLLKNWYIEQGYTKEEAEKDIEEAEIEECVMITYNNGVKDIVKIKNEPKVFSYEQANRLV